MMDVKPDIDVEIAVVGGGPTGLSAALALAETGATVALIAPPAPPEDFRTAALLSGSVELLDGVGAWSGLVDKAAPLKTMRLVDGTRRLVRAPEIAFHAAEIGLEAFGWNLLNADITGGLGALVAERAGKMVHVDDTAASVDPSGSKAVVTTTDGRRVAARLLVAADGRRSLLREAAGIEAKTWSYPQTALVLNLTHSAPHQDTSTEFHTETGPFTLVPLGPKRSSLVCVERPEVAERLDGLDDEALAADLERRAHSLLGALTVASKRQLWPLSGLSADRMGAGRVVLVGEAGHAFPPIGAQGLNLGLRDVAALAEIVRRARARRDDVGGDEVVARYAKARKADVASRSLGVDLLNRSLLTDLLPVQIARAVAVQFARSAPPLRKLMMREGLRPRLFGSL